MLTVGDNIRNADIRRKVGVVDIEDKIMENRLRWFGHVSRRLEFARVRKVKGWGYKDLKCSRGCQR